MTPGLKDVHLEGVPSRSIVRRAALMVLAACSFVLHACSPTPFGYVLSPIETAMAPPGKVIITRIVTPPPVVVVVGPPTPTAKRETPTPAPEVEITVDWANVRSGPGTSYGVVAGLAKGARVRVQGTSGDGTWVYVVVPTTGDSGWLKSGAIDAAGLPHTMPTVPAREGTPSVALQTGTQLASATPIGLGNRAEFLLMGLMGLPDTPQYDPTTNVLHKYVDHMDVDVTSTSITITLLRAAESSDDFIGLGFEVLLFAAIVSSAGEAGDWGVSTISLIDPGPGGSYARLFLEGHPKIAQVVSGETAVYDIMEVEVEWGSPTP